VQGASPAGDTIHWTVFSRLASTVASGLPPLISVKGTITVGGEVVGSVIAVLNGGTHADPSVHDPAGPYVTSLSSLGATPAWNTQLSKVPDNVNAIPVYLEASTQFGEPNPTPNPA